MKQFSSFVAMTVVVALVQVLVARSSDAAFLPSVRRPVPNDDQILRLEDCYCSPFNNWCSDQDGPSSIGCARTDFYVQCIEDQCTLQVCDNGTLWHPLTRSCTPCADGLHIDTKNHRCVCDEGTTWNSKSKECAACPTGSTMTEDEECKCPSSLVLNHARNACVPCPLNTRVERETCQCLNGSLFYNEQTEQCQDCPGTWAPSSFFGSPKCQCYGAPYIFDRKTVSCVMCPPDSTAVISTDDRPDHCRCNLLGAEYTRETGCKCPRGMILNVLKGICEVIRVVDQPDSSTTSSRSSDEPIDSTTTTTAWPGIDRSTTTTAWPGIDRSTTTTAWPGIDQSTTTTASSGIDRSTTTTASSGIERSTTTTDSSGIDRSTTTTASRRIDPFNP